MTASVIEAAGCMQYSDLTGKSGDRGGRTPDTGIFKAQLRNAIYNRNSHLRRLPPNASVVQQQRSAVECAKRTP